MLEFQLLSSPTNSSHGDGRLTMEVVAMEVVTIEVVTMEVMGFTTFIMMM